MMLVACSSGDYKKALSNAKDAIAQDELREAEVQIEKALHEKPKEIEAKSIQALIRDLVQVEQAITNQEFGVAQKLLNRIKERVTDDLATNSMARLQEEIDQLTLYAEQFTEDMNRLTAHLNANETDAAKVLLDKWRKTDNVYAQKIAEQGKEQVEAQQDALIRAMEQRAEQAEQQAKVEAAKKVEKAPAPSSGGSKALYQAKLATVQQSEQEYAGYFEQGITAEIREGQGYIYEMWDDMLNEVYAELKQNLPESEFIKLRDSQRKWIKTRDAKIEEVLGSEAPSELGTAHFMGANEVAIEETRKRTYWLVENYMK